MHSYVSANAAIVLLSLAVRSAAPAEYARLHRPDWLRPYPRRSAGSVLANTRRSSRSRPSLPHALVGMGGWMDAVRTVAVDSPTACLGWVDATDVGE